MSRKYQEVKLQENKPGWLTMTLPQKVAKWLDARKGDKLGFEPLKGVIRIFKLE